MKLYKNLNSALKERDEARALKITLKEKNFPTDIFHLTHLEELYLEGSCEIFPAELMALSKLKILSLKFENNKSDLSGVFSLPSLENLKIIETPIKMFLLPLGKINAPLKFLSVKGSGLEILPEEISMMVHLEELHLPQNKLTQLPFAFRELKKLKRLNLDSNNFSSFPDLIGELKNLKHLSIDGNHFNDEEKARIQRTFHITPN